MACTTGTRTLYSSISPPFRVGDLALTKDGKHIGNNTKTQQEVGFSSHMLTQITSFICIFAFEVIE